MLGPSPSQKRDPEPDHRNPNPRCAPNCWGACVGIFTPREREIRVTLRTVAAGVFGGCCGRWLRELSKGGVTDGGCGSSRRVTLRTVAAGGCGGCRGRWLLAAVGRGARRSFPLPSAVAPPFVPSAAVGRGASLRPFRCRRPWRLPSSLPLPSAVTPSEDFRCRRPWRLPYLSFARCKYALVAFRQFGAHLGFGLRWSGSGSRF